MSTIGPKSEQEIKFDEINRATDYNTKRLLIENLTNAERAAYSIQMQNRFAAKMPTITPAADLLKNLNTAKANIAMDKATDSANTQSAENSPATKPTFS